MTPDLTFWILATIATFLVGASKGGLPGVGILSVPILALAVSPVVAAGLLLPLYIVSDIYGLWLYRNSYELRVIKIVVAAAAIGVLFGWFTASYNSDALTKIIIGLVGIWYAIDILVSRNRNKEPKSADIPRGLFWGSLTGFTSFVAHAGGVPYQMYVLPQKLDKMVYAGTSTITFAIINLMKLPPYALLGQVNVGSLTVCALLTPVALFGAFVGYRLTRAIPQDIFYKVVEVALFILSAKLLYDGTTAYL